jgi:hypothetical protein
MKLDARVRLASTYLFETSSQGCTLDHRLEQYQLLVDLMEYLH